MKKILIALLMCIVFIGCTKAIEPLKQSNQNIDSIQILKAKLDSTVAKQALLNAKLIVLTDSVKKLSNRPLMTKQLYIEVYKYESLLKKFKICQHNPSQWKYYNGWSTRIFLSPTGD